MAFSSMIGQDDIKARLGAALVGHPGHAYAFTGPDGIGKTLLARLFAKALLCQRPSLDGACDRCDACHHFDNGVHPDFRSLELEKNDKTIKVDRVRKYVCGDVDLRPQFGNRKVYLIEADDLNEQGQNALLKTLEDSPQYCFFLLTVTSPGRLLPTILSRVSQLVLKRYSPDEIGRILSANGLDAGSENVFLARFSGGLAGIAMDLHSNSWFSELRQETLDLISGIARQSRASLLTDGYQFFDKNRSHAPAILDIIGSLVRDLLVLWTSRSYGQLTNQDQQALLERLLPEQNNENRERARRHLTDAYQAVLSARRGLDLNASFEGLVCNLLLNLRKEFQYA